MMKKLSRIIKNRFWEGYYSLRIMWLDEELEGIEKQLVHSDVSLERRGWLKNQLESVQDRRDDYNDRRNHVTAG